MMTETTASKASYLSSGGATVLGLLTLQDWAVIIGIFLAVATFAVNVYFQRKRDAREVELAELAKAAHVANMGETKQELCQNGQEE